MRFFLYQNIVTFAIFGVVVLLLDLNIDSKAIYFRINLVLYIILLSPLRYTIMGRQHCRIDRSGWQSACFGSVWFRSRSGSVSDSQKWFYYVFGKQSRLFFFFG
jgi:hypothetical protein